MLSIMNQIAILNLYSEIKYLKRMRDRFDVEEEGVLYFGITNETIAEYHRKYAYFCNLLAKTRNYLWNISPDYRKHYPGKFNSVMAIF